MQHLSPSQAFEQLRDELAAALTGNPLANVSTPAFLDKQTRAIDVVNDDFAGTEGDASLELLIRVCARAALAGDTDAKRWIDETCARHAAWHRDDLLDGEDECARLAA